MPKSRQNNLINSAMILVGATIVVKVIGALYKIPLTSIIGGVGRGYFSTAYNIYTPVYAISMAGLPTAVSKMISEQMALGNYGTVKSIKKVAIKIFILTGILGTFLLVFTAYPYAKYVAGAIGVIPCILTIAPSIFFCCLMSAYRGYYEGQQDMRPTAWSQVIEAVSKLVFGLLLSNFFLNKWVNEFKTYSTVFGEKVSTMEEAMSKIYPYTAAVAVFGVTLGTVFGMLYIMLRRQKTNYNFNIKPTMTQKEIVKMLVTIAVPIVVGSLIQNVSNLIDTATIQNRLEYAMKIDSYSVIMKMYSQSLSISGTMKKDITTYLFGVYNSALDFKNLIPTVTLAIGISALPTMSRAWTLKDKPQINWIVNSVIKFSLVIGLPVGFGMAAIPQGILSLVYGNSNPDLVPLAAPIVKIYGLSMILFAVSGPLISMLQAIGRADVTVMSMAVGAVVKIVLNYVLIGIPIYNIKGAPISTICCYIVIVLWNLFMLIKETKTSIEFKEFIFKPLIASCICGISAYFVYNFMILRFSSNISTVVSVSVSALIYCILLFSLSIITKKEINILCKR